MTILTTAQPARHPNPTARARSLSHLIFERPDLARASKFFVDFGLHVVEENAEEVRFSCGAQQPFCIAVRLGPRVRFVGFGFRVASDAELDALARLAGSQTESAGTGGEGRVVRLVDPSGFTVEAALELPAEAERAHRPAMKLNNAEEHPRINEPQRPPIAAAELLRLGHVVLEVAAFQRTSAWYTEHFGLIPSDVQVLPDGSPAVAFLRLDLGDQPADHHTLALAQSAIACYGHSAYEVVDLDAVAMAGRVLSERGRKHSWGIGRHILGSQIFNYWCDPWGAKFEHYTDGDLFNSAVPMGVHPVSLKAMFQWGPPMPREFTRPHFDLNFLRQVAHNVRTVPDLTLQKLRTLQRIFT